MAEAITLLLSEMAAGDPQAFNRLTAIVYPELHRLAKSSFRSEGRAHTLQPTALIHEAYLRLAGNDRKAYRNRAHFFAIAARVMRQILVDHARARRAVKRGSGGSLPFDENLDFSPERQATVVSLDDALNALARDDERKARIVEMRYFGGMTAEEIAPIIDMPAYTVRRELRLAQAWLRREIDR